MSRRAPSRSGGLLIDTWHWKYQGVDLSSHLQGDDDDPMDGPFEAVQLVKDQIVPIEVRMLKTLDDGALPRTVKTVEFLVVCPPLNIRLQGSDIEVLRQAVWAKLERTFEIKWERWYLVQIASAQSFVGDRETGFALSQNTIYRGVAKDGTVLMREYDRGRTSSPWRYKPWPAEYEDRGGHVLACIPATEANEVALNEFRARILALQERLSDLVKPQVILKTLADLSQVGLPALTRNADR